MRSILLTLILVISTYAGTINYYAIGKVNSSTIASKITGRFNASGEPLFLIHDVNSGLAVGDYIKFQDKMVLIDGQVWQTLAAENVFENMENIRITTLRGGSSSREWQQKSQMMSTEYSRKSYILGAEIMKIFEEQFASLPQNESILINFNRGRATLVVPNQLINSLTLQRITRAVHTGEMVWTVPPCEFAYADVPFSWQPWAADPSEPAGAISYSVTGDLPEGLTWSRSRHTIEGTPTITGVFPLSITARSVNKRITMACTLSVTHNKLPMWANAPDTVRVSDEAIQYPLIFSDFESASREIAVTLDSVPDGFSYSDSLQTLNWTPIDTMNNLEGSIDLTLEDPMGGIEQYSIPVYFVPDGVDIGYTFASLTPPWDTLVEGVTYEWDLTLERQHWSRNHLEMRLGDCSDTVVFDDTVLIMKPGIDTTFTVMFRFRDRNREITQYEMTLPVIRNRPPHFEAFPDQWDVEVNDFAYFTPEASDPEGEDVTLTLRSSDSGFVYHEGVLSFSAADPGTYQAFFEAEDTYGNVAVQQVTYYVKQVYDKYRGMKIETGMWPGTNSWSSSSWGFMNPWRFHGETPAIRFGIFSPDDVNLFNSDDFQMPFLYAGAELIPAHKRAEGLSVAADLGFSYNVITQEIHTFGLYVNLEARATMQEFFNSQLDFRFLFFARHMLRKVSVNYTINDDGELDYSAVKNLELLEKYLSPDNLNLLMSGSHWFHIGSGFFMGPAFQLRVSPVAMTMDYEEDPEDADSTIIVMDETKKIFMGFAGVGIRSDIKYNMFQMENRVRLGYGGHNYGMMFYWDISLGFGRFKR